MALMPCKQMTQSCPFFGTTHNHLKGGCDEVGVGLFSGNKGNGQEERPQVAPQEVYTGCKEKCFHPKGYEGLEQTAQGSG